MKVINTLNQRIIQNELYSKQVARIYFSARRIASEISDAPMFAGPGQVISGFIVCKYRLRQAPMA
jgi:hypothetical protein